jgi:hypothetical protein
MSRGWKKAVCFPLLTNEANINKAGCILIPSDLDRILADSYNQQIKLFVELVSAKCALNLQN